MGAGDAGEERIGVVHDLAEELPRRRRQELDLRDERGDDVADFEQLRNFAESPLEAIDENDRNPLVFAERLEDGSEARIEPPLVRLVASERDWFSSLTTFALAHAKEVSDSVIEQSSLAPVLPGPAQSLRRRVASSLKSVGGHQGPSQRRLVLANELFEFRSWRISHRAPICSHLCKPTKSLFLRQPDEKLVPRATWSFIWAS